MTDIVERLRTNIAWLERDGFLTSVSNTRDAIVEIERLRAENAELRKAQGEPVAYLHIDGYSITHPQSLPNTTNPADWSPLYTSAPSIPEGWQLVPVEPTPEMLKAANLAGDDDVFGIKSAWPSDTYKSMLAAAPKYNT